MMRHRAWRATWAAAVLCAVTAAASAQDLDPRAYAYVPIDATFLISGFAVSRGDVLSDPTLPITDIRATVESPSLALVRTFSLFGRTSQVLGALPYSWAQMTGNVLGEANDTTRAGLSDMRLRVSILVRGAPAASVPEILKAPRRTILGTSLTVSAPAGEYSPSKLINLGTNRWAFKPEFAVSHPIGQRWLLDTYAGVWLFTDNEAYYPGAIVRTQRPLGAFQAHLSYNFPPVSWAAFDATYYVGGRTTVQGVENNDRQSNSGVGATLVLDCFRRVAVANAALDGSS